mmetsp:Transcript_3996/g.9300  ORF Transcript_3996/g.9300 Transcript_3996/m.9300 type:complete len:239 (+) Transcript_3996:1094-1810(+)
MPSSSRRIRTRTFSANSLSRIGCRCLHLRCSSPRASPRGGGNTVKRAPRAVAAIPGRSPPGRGALRWLLVRSIPKGIGTMKVDLGSRSGPRRTGATAASGRRRQDRMAAISGSRRRLRGMRPLEARRMLAPGPRTGLRRRLVGGRSNVRRHRLRRRWSRIPRHPELQQLRQRRRRTGTQRRRRRHQPRQNPQRAGTRPPQHQRGPTRFVAHTESEAAASAGVSLSEGRCCMPERRNGV